MCDHCGCSTPTAGSGHGHEHGPGHHHHPHHHDHDEEKRTIELHQSLMTRNNLLAERNRGYFLGRGILALNLMSSPGSGKTAILERTLRELREEFKMATLVGDLATDNDAARLRQAGCPAVQITTGAVCHLDAHMIQHALEEVASDPVELLFIENVGNLVCPSGFDLGEALRVVVMAVTEGEDKPRKYPSIFQNADVVLINKVDLAEAVEWNRASAWDQVGEAAPHAAVLEVSARTGAGMNAWYALLRERLQARRTPRK